LLNLIAGFVPYQHGSITLAGNRVDGPGADRGVVFQNEGLLPWRNVQDNVAFGLQLAGWINYSVSVLPWNVAESRAGGRGQTLYLAAFRWTAAARRHCAGAGGQSTVVVAGFGALDAFTREQMQTLLLKLWHETGKQVLLITHDIEEAVFMATELVLLSPGPGRVLERLPLNFARRFVAGESSRSIKSDPQFIAMREYVLGRVFEQREAFS
jgi:taurine transport system ATP-binding protein